MQTWYKPHPYGVYPRGNATRQADLVDRLGTLSRLIYAVSPPAQLATCAGDNKVEEEEKSGAQIDELAFLELVQAVLAYCEVSDLCRLSRACTGWYVLVHCTDAFRTAHTALSPRYLSYHGSWKETAIRAYVRQCGGPAARKRPRKEKNATDAATRQAAAPAPATSSAVAHTPVLLHRPFFSDTLFQAWMCTLLPPYYHLHRRTTVVAAAKDDDGNDARLRSITDNTADGKLPWWRPVTAYGSAFRDVPRCRAPSVDDFVARYEGPNVPVILTDIATHWPLFHLLQGDFANLARKAEEGVLLRGDGRDCSTPFRCEYTRMSLADYVRYATTQHDERPIYLFDAEFASTMAVEALYTVPPHFARDDYFAALGERRRPKYRWLIAGPARGGSSFHVDPNYTNAWNANLTGRKRWLLFPPGVAPPGVVPSANMAEVATPVSLTEWLLNFYDASVAQLRAVGYECVCEPGEIMFVPSGWWHAVINLEDSVAITHNYVSRSNVRHVVQFLRTMKSSISGFDEDAEQASEADVQRRQESFADEFTAAMRAAHPLVMQRVEDELAAAAQQRAQRHVSAVTLLDGDAEGFKFAF